MTEIHHKAQPPHEVCTPIPLLVPDDFTIPFNLQKAPQITTKSVKENYISTTSFQW